MDDMRIRELVQQARRLLRRPESGEENVAEGDLVALLDGLGLPADPEGALLPSEALAELRDSER